MDKLHEIDTQNSIVDIIQRLPNYIQHRWKKIALSKQPVILIRQGFSLFFAIFSVYLIYNIRYTVTYVPWSPEVGLLLHPAGARAGSVTAKLFGSYYFSIWKVGISAAG